jgi:hypothetical protein
VAGKHNKAWWDDKTDARAHCGGLRAALGGAPVVYVRGFGRTKAANGLVRFICVGAPDCGLSHV